MTDPEASSELERIIKTAGVELQHIHPGLFSAEGFQRLKDRIDEYIGELTVESVKVAKRHQSDSVSPAYVDQASEHLTSGKPARWQRVVGGIGNCFRRWPGGSGLHGSIGSVFYARISSQCHLHCCGHAGFHVPHHEGISGRRRITPKLFREFSFLVPHETHVFSFSIRACC